MLTQIYSFKSKRDGFVWFVQEGQEGKFCCFKQWYWICKEYQPFLRLFLFGGGFTRLQASSSATREVLCIKAVSFRGELGKTIHVLCLQWATPVYLFYPGRFGYRLSTSLLNDEWKLYMEHWNCIWLWKNVVWPQHLFWESSCYFFLAHLWTLVLMKLSINTPAFLCVSIHSRILGGEVKLPLVWRKNEFFHVRKT